MPRQRPALRQLREQPLLILPLARQQLDQKRHVRLPAIAFQQLRVPLANLHIERGRRRRHEQRQPVLAEPEPLLQQEQRQLHLRRSRSRKPRLHLEVERGYRRFHPLHPKRIPRRQWRLPFRGCPRRPRKPHHPLQVERDATEVLAEVIGRARVRRNGLRQRFGQARMVVGGRRRGVGQRLGHRGEKASTRVPARGCGVPAVTRLRRPVESRTAPASSVWTASSPPPAAPCAGTVLRTVPPRRHHPPPAPRS